MPEVRYHNYFFFRGKKRLILKILALLEAAAKPETNYSSYWENFYYLAALFLMGFDLFFLCTVSVAREAARQAIYF